MLAPWYSLNKYVGCQVFSRPYFRSLRDSGEYCCHSKWQITSETMVGVVLFGRIIQYDGAVVAVSPIVRLEALAEKGCGGRWTNGR